MSTKPSAFFQHELSLVESDQIGAGTRVWAFAQVMKNATVGKDCNVGGHAFIESGARVGNGVTIKNHVCIWDGVTIEDGVFLGPRVVFTNDLYPRSPRMPSVTSRYQSTSEWLVPTTVQFGCSIGAGSTIVPGITLGPGAMIAAGSVVTRDVPPFALMMGLPARHVGDVCLCGQKLNGCFTEITCECCGQTGPERQQIADGNYPVISSSDD